MDLIFHILILRKPSTKNFFCGSFPTWAPQSVVSPKMSTSVLPMPHFFIAQYFDYLYPSIPRTAILWLSMPILGIIKHYNQPFEEHQFFITYPLKCHQFFDSSYSSFDCPGLFLARNSFLSLPILIFWMVIHTQYWLDLK